MPYSEIKNLDEYLNVHKKAMELTTIVAHANIGCTDGIAIIAKNYNVTKIGGNAYVFNNSALDNVNNANFTLEKTKPYTIQINASGHPFILNSVQETGTGNSYNNGVTNNGIVSEKIIFTVPANVTNTIFYNCEFHGIMTGVIRIIDSCFLILVIFEKNWSFVPIFLLGCKN